jgi:hypothetical protein
VCIGQPGGLPRLQKPPTALCIVMARMLLVVLVLPLVHVAHTVHISESSTCCFVCVVLT